MWPVPCYFAHGAAQSASVHGLCLLAVIFRESVDLSSFSVPLNCKIMYLRHVNGLRNAMCHILYVISYGVAPLLLFTWFIYCISVKFYARFSAIIHSDLTML